MGDAGAFRPWVGTRTHHLALYLGNKSQNGVVVTSAIAYRDGVWALLARAFRDRIRFAGQVLGISYQGSSAAVNSCLGEWASLVQVGLLQVPK